MNQFGILEAFWIVCTNRNPSFRGGIRAYKVRMTERCLLSTSVLAIAIDQNNDDNNDGTQSFQFPLINLVTETVRRVFGDPSKRKGREIKNGDK